MTPYETGVDYETVTIPSSYDEHEIQGWWFPHPESNRVIIYCSGYRGTKSELLGIATFLWRQGFNALLFDYHGHGSGRGAPVTLGYQEMHDFMDALEYTKRRLPNARVGVFGASMGASLAIMGAARHPEILAVVADSPFATHTDVVTHNVERVVRLPGVPSCVSPTSFFTTWPAIVAATWSRSARWRTSRHARCCCSTAPPTA